MKIICEKSELVKSINIVSKAVPVRTTMSVLECILIDASGTYVTMTANDMELAIETKLNGTILERGIAAINAKMLSEIVRKLPKNEVTIQVDENYNATISCGKAVFQIPGKDGEDFSRLPLLEKNEPVIISQATLRDMIHQTIFSIAQNDTNRIMTGESFEISEDHLRVISLDGHRISIRNTALNEITQGHKVIVPGKTLSEISKILSGEAEDLVSVYVTENHICFELEDTVIVSRLIEGNYFKVDQMIPTDFETRIAVNRREMMESIDRSILFVNEEDKKPIVLSITEDSIDLSIRSQKGSFDDHIEANKEGKDLKIGFNPKFLLDAMRVIDEEEIEIFFVNSKAPCIIKNEAGSYMYMILPVNFV